MAARLVFAVLLGAAGCVQTIDHPEGTGAGGTGGSGGGGGGGGGADAGVDAAAGQLSGTLCRLTDLRFFDVCTATDLSAIDVAVRGSSATAQTAADGSFVIDRPASGPIVIEVGFDTADVKASLFEVAADADQVSVPVVLQADYDALLDALLVVEPDGTGSIAVYARDGDAPIAGVEVVPPSGSQAPFYDAGSALEWSQLGLTGAGGAALIFSVNDDGGAALSLVDPNNVSIDLTPPVTEAALSFAVGQF